MRKKKMKRRLKPWVEELNLIQRRSESRVSGGRD